MFWATLTSTQNFATKFNILNKHLAFFFVPNQLMLAEEFHDPKAILIVLLVEVPPDSDLVPIKISSMKGVPTPETFSSRLSTICCNCWNHS
jgi:hypothetical protein